MSMTMHDDVFQQLTAPAWCGPAGSEVRSGPIMPVQEWHIRDLEKRRVAGEAKSAAGSFWDELKARLTIRS